MRMIDELICEWKGHDWKRLYNTKGDRDRYFCIRCLENGYVPAGIGENEVPEDKRRD